MKNTINGIKGSDFWINSADLDWISLQNASNLMIHWRVYGYIKHLCYNFGIFPVNKYVLDLYPKPELMSIVDNRVTFRQRTHAEIWVQPEEDGLYALDKCWQRQFYPSPNKMDNDKCFDATYRFYIPWVPISLGSFSIKTVNDEETPFLVNQKEYSLMPPSELTDFYQTDFVDFMIKKDGSHMHDARYGIIEIGTPMYDISVEMNEGQIEKVIQQYGR
jgi:hypothetical protein